jgi:hypothetical protein
MSDSLPPAASRPGRRLPPRADLLAVVALLAFALALDADLNAHGMFFVATPLEHFWQVLDPEWLQQDLWSSLWHLHAQPPGFNLLIGLGLQGFGKAYQAGFDRLYQGLAIAILLLLYAAQRALKIPAWIAALVCLAWSVYPAFIYFQNFLFYPILVQAFLLLAALLLALAFQRSPAYLAGFFLALFLLFITRASFNSLYFLLALGILLLSQAFPWRQVLRLAAPGLLLVLLFSLKNWLLFGVPSTSSWLGMNLANVTLSALSPAEKERLAAQEAIPPLVLAGAFNDIQDYPHEVWGPLAQACRGPDALCQPYKTNGEPNLNFIGYIPVSQAFLRASLFTIWNYPQRILGRVGMGWRIYFSPATLTIYLNDRSFAPIAPLAQASDRLLCGEIGSLLDAAPCYPLQAAYFGMILAAAGALFLRSRSGAAVPGERIVILFLLATLAYAALVGSALDLGENNRFRLETDPLIMLLFGYCLAHLPSAWSRRPPFRLSPP